MRTDELRRGLRELADEVGPFESDLPGLRRSERRRAVLLRAGAGLVVILAVVGAVAFWDRGAKHARVEVPTKEFPVESLHRVELVVVPANGRVQRVLEGSPLVARYTRVTQIPMSFAGLAEPPPGLINALVVPKELQDAACALRRTPGFGVQSTTPDLDTGRKLADALGDTGRVFTIGRPGTDLEVFMKVNATPAQVSTVRAALDANTAQVKSYRFLDHDAAFDEFKTIFVDQPDLIGSTTPAELPESFRVLADEDASLDDIETGLKLLSGVDKVVRVNQSFANGVSSNQTSCRTP